MAIRNRQAVISIMFAAMMATGLVALPITASAQPTIQSEQAAHPLIMEAIRNCEQAYRQLDAAPDQFGGHKAQAMIDLRKSIRSMKRALYFRLKLSDAQIDRIQ